MKTETNKIGFWSAIFTTVLALITFSIAIFTPPLSGPYCVSNCYTYPYLDITSRFPRDYYWMYPAIVMTIIFYILMVAIHDTVLKDKKIFSYLGLSFAFMSTTILVIDYFLQISVIQPSLLGGEMDGISLLSQFNPHGIFIALEEIGFIMMSVSMLCMSRVFTGQTKIEKSVKWIFTLCFSLTALAFIFYFIFYGMLREYRFEVAVISINWFALILSGVFLSLYFRQRMKISS